MFEIGNSLREARLRQGLELARAENDTKIRSKYLKALEEERFDVLPGQTYAKGFLRAYADYLGLDGQLYVDEFNSRFASGEEFPVAPAGPPRRRAPSVESNFVVVTLAAIVALFLLVVVAWTAGSDDQDPPTAVPNTTAPTTTAKAGGAKAAKQKPARKRRPRVARLVLRAARGDCWLEVHAATAMGELLYQGTLEQGQSLRFVRKRLWMLVGAGHNLRATLNGKRVAFPVNTSAVVTARGVRPTS